MIKWNKRAKWRASEQDNEKGIRRKQEKQKRYCKKEGKGKKERKGNA